MEDHGLVSVIIPVFNVRPYVTEALESVLSQSYINLEIIIIDDGSTDGSGKICDEFQKEDRRVHVIHQRNMGLSAARNAGLGLMTGEVVAFLDSDDAYHSDFIKTMLLAMIHDKSDIVICKYVNCPTTGKMHLDEQENKKPLLHQGIYDKSEALRALVDDRLNHSAWNKLYRRALWDRIRFPDGQVYEDTATTYRIIDSCKIISVIEQPLYMYRKRPGSIIETFSKENIVDWLKSCSQLESFVKQHIPDIFTDMQLLKLRQSRINGMVSYYHRLYFKKRKEENIFLKNLRKRIIEEGKQYGVGKCGVRKKMCYWIVCTYPELFIITGPPFFFVRQLYRRFFVQWRKR